MHIFTFYGLNSFLSFLKSYEKIRFPLKEKRKVCPAHVSYKIPESMQSISPAELLTAQVKPATQAGVYSVALN